MLHESTDFLVQGDTFLWSGRCATSQDSLNWILVDLRARPASFTEINMLIMSATNSRNLEWIRSRV